MRRVRWHRSYVIAALGVMTVSLAGCADGLIPRSPRPPIRHPYYSFGFYNASSGETLDGVSIQWMTDGMQCAAQAGFLPPDPEHHGMGKLEEEQPDPIPAGVTLNWRGGDGKRHVRTMEVAPRVPNLKTFTGTIYFKYTGDGGWRVIPLSQADEDHLAEQGKPIIPPDPPPVATAPTTRG